MLKPHKQTSHNNIMIIILSDLLCGCIGFIAYNVNSSVNEFDFLGNALTVVLFTALLLSIPHIYLCILASRKLKLCPRAFKMLKKC